MYEELEEKRICVDCIGEAYLKEDITAIGQKSKCDYCGQKNCTETLKDLSERVAYAFEQHYYRTSPEPSFFEYTAMKEGGSDWERDGIPIIDLIAELLWIDEEAAEEIHCLLEYDHDDFEAAKMGEECEFSSDSHYSELEVDDEEFMTMWGQLEDSIKKEARYFNPQAKKYLDFIFEDIHQIDEDKSDQILVEVGPNKQIENLYRARLVQSPETLETILKDPNIQLGPPEYQYARAGRMNPKGVSVFYGSNKRETAMSEVRPPIGSQIVTGKFKIIKPLTLLNLEGLRELQVTGSVFDPDYANDLKRSVFLSKLDDLMSKPVMPNDEDFDYMITQTIAEYLSGIFKPKIDGIIFKSVQHTEGKNIILFHSSSKVEPDEDIKRDVNIRIYKNIDYDEMDYEYSVLEIEGEDKDETIETTDLWGFDMNNDMVYDYSLKLVIESLKIHEVEGIKYLKSERKITRDRITKESYERIPF